MTPAMANSRGLAAFFATTLALGAFGCKDDQLEGAQAEVQQGKIKVTVPAVPAFEVPKPYPDGSHSVKEMRVMGEKYLKTEVAVTGVVVWAYDCVTAIKQAGESDEAVKKRIETDPTVCRRPAFYLGDTESTPPERALWVVEVPRPATALEIKNLPKEEIAARPAVPPYKVGDKVTVTGTWSVSSPHGESNTDGLLVYSRMKNETQAWETPAADPSALPPATKAPPPH
jgi:hypothetical protein